jgi:hypothetical protein
MVRAVRALGFALTLSSVAVFATACSNTHPIAPSPVRAGEAAALSVAGTQAGASAQSVTTEQACWGQASQVFARMGVMGEHSSSFSTPRLGLRNLARLLHQQGVLPDDSMQSLGAFVASSLGLTIDACL